MFSPPSVSRTLPNDSLPGSDDFQEERLTELPLTAILSEPPSTLGNVDEQDQHFPPSSPDAEEPLTSPQMTPREGSPFTPQPQCPQDLPLQGSPFTQISTSCSQDLSDPASPLTPVSSLFSQDQEAPQSPIAETAIPMSCLVHSNTTPRKRKNSPHKPQRNKKSRYESDQDLFEEDQVGLSVWPPTIDGDISQKVSSIIFPPNRVTKYPLHNSILGVIGVSAGTTLAV